MAKIGNQGDGGGRPMFAFTRDQITQIENLASVLTKKQMADFFGICENTFRECENRQPEVNEAYKKGKGKAIAGVATNLISQARNGNVAAAIFYLKTQAGWREDNLQDLQNSPVTINIVKPDGND